MDGHALEKSSKNNLKRVVILDPRNEGSRGLYQVLGSFSDGFAEAFKKKGFEILYWKQDGWQPEFETCDFSFSVYAPFMFGPPELRWDYNKIPNIQYTVDTLDYFSEKAFDERFILTVRDELYLQILTNLGSKTTLFLPHAGDPAVTFISDQARPYDITMSCSSPAFSTVNYYLADKHPLIQQAVRLTPDIYFKDPLITHHQAFLTSAALLHIDKSELSKLNLPVLMQIVEFFIRYEDRLALLKSIKNHPIHLFGDTSDREVSWKVILEGQDNIIYHPPISFAETIEVMKQSKIVLNASAQIKLGAHERIFYSALAGALPLTSENLYLKRWYQDERDILFYEPHKTSDIEPKITRFLKNETLRATAAEKGRQIVLAHHTWDNRVHELLNSPQLKKLKEMK